MKDEQDVVSTILQAMPPPDVRPDFVARVNARIDASAGWFGLLDFRTWTLRLAPAAAALALLAVFWSTPSGSSASTATVSTASSATFSPASSMDWQKDVSGDAMLDAALSPRGDADAR
jgi:hypothetical protein